MPRLTRNHVIKRKGRLIYTEKDRAGKKAVVIKRYQSASHATQEARVMQAYGDSQSLVRLHRFFVRQAKGYIVMERIKGSTLRDLIKKRGPFSPSQVIAIAIEILKGVNTLHAAGYVHGDLHSGNIIVTRLSPPKVKIIDFQHAVRKNAAGMAQAKRALVRPPAKLAPETRRLMINDRYDIYGVGFMCASMLKGRDLKRRPRELKMATGGSGQISRLWRVIRKATQPVPSRRYSSAREMIKALKSV